jgi:thioredoxin-like negative regulator of GroEL
MSVPITDATPETFDALVAHESGELVVVDFWGPQCPNCEAFATAAPSLLESLGDAPVRLVKVNAYRHEELARRFGLHGIPTFLLFRDGRLIGRMSQYYGRDYWLRVIRDHLPQQASTPPIEPRQ